MKLDTKPFRTRPRFQIAQPGGRFHEHRGFILLVLGALVLWMNLTFIVPLVMGAIFAIVLYPLMLKMSHWRVSSTWKAAILTTGFAISFLLPLGAIIFFGAEGALTKIQELQTQGFNPSKLSPDAVIEMLGLRPLVERISDFTPVSDSQIKQMATRVLAASGLWLINVLQTLLASLPGATFSTLIILITLFFLLIDGRRAARFIGENSIFGPKETDKIFSAVTSLCYSVVVASIAAGAVQAGLILVGCLITGTHGAILIALIAFVLSFLPVFGTAPVTLFLFARALLMGDLVTALIFAVFVVLVGLSDNIVRPYVLRGGASLHPLIGFVAAFGALDAIGFYGVFIGPVVAGLFFVMLPMITRTYARSNVRI